MSLFDKLKSLLGLGRSGSSTGEKRDVSVTVEREQGSEPDARTERAVKESVDGGTGGASTAEDAEPAAKSEPSAESDSGSSTEPETGSSTESDTEPATGSSTEPETGSSTESGTEPATESDTESPDEPRVPSEAVDVIKGIGPTYAERLSGAGVETVADLAAADAEDVAQRADVPEGRLKNWIEKANARSR